MGFSNSHEVVHISMHLDLTDTQLESLILTVITNMLGSHPNFKLWLNGDPIKAYKLPIWVPIST